MRSNKAVCSLASNSPPKFNRFVTHETAFEKTSQIHGINLHCIIATEKQKGKKTKPTTFKNERLLTQSFFLLGWAVLQLHKAKSLYIYVSIAKQPLNDSPFYLNSQGTLPCSISFYHSKKSAENQFTKHKLCMAKRPSERHFLFPHA